MTSEDHNNIPQLNGFVLAGGKSVRMGRDKGVMQWHGQEQRYYMADLLQNICSDVFISCRPEQQSEINSNYNVLPDSYIGSGPFGAILSALEAKPGKAWLVTACDLPLLDMPTLMYLIEHRDTSSLATTFESPFDGLPEPLITIWEPASYPVLLSFLSEGFTCPRKVLIRNKERVKILTPPDPDALINTNTPEDVQKVKEIIDQHQ